MPGHAGVSSLATPLRAPEDQVVSWIVAVILTEAIVQLSVDALPLAPLRARAADLHPLLGVLASCGYCQSVWVGMGVALLFSLSVGLPGALDTLAAGLVVHRASNIWHDGLSWWRDRLPWTIVRVGGGS